MSALELRVPPVALAIAVAVLMRFVATITPSLAFAPPGRVVLAPALASLGVAVALAGVAAFRSASTTVDPTRPHGASSLVTGGIYRITRSPMYLGFALALTAWAVWLCHPLAGALAAAFVAWIDRFRIRPEERALRERFGQPFETYARTVRRWL